MNFVESLERVKSFVRGLEWTLNFISRMLSWIEVFGPSLTRKEGRSMCQDEGVGRTESGSGTESCHLEGPSDGNCTVERRDAGVCVPSAYIYIYLCG